MSDYLKPSRDIIKINDEIKEGQRAYSDTASVWMPCVQLLPTVQRGILIHNRLLNEKHQIELFLRKISLKRRVLKKSINSLSLPFLSLQNSKVKSDQVFSVFLKKCPSNWELLGQMISKATGPDRKTYGNMNCSKH